MAIQISGITVINDSRELGAGLTSIYDNVGAATTSMAVSNRDYYYVSNSNATITLPAGPVAGNEVVVGVGNFTTTVIARNGSNIMGLAEDLTVDVANASCRLIYVDATRGWVLS